MDKKDAYMIKKYINIPPTTGGCPLVVYENDKCEQNVDKDFTFPYNLKVKSIEGRSTL